MKYKTIIDRSALQNEDCLSLSRETGVCPITAAILISRGFCNKSDAADFLDRRGGALHDPMLLPDMEAAAKRLLKAVADRENILIYGDYDADGVTATAVAYLYLRSKGANVRVHIPDRFKEGYGICKETLDLLIDGGVTFILTVDTGSKAIAEIECAYARGVPVTVTDHHECGQTLPVCEAVVNPMRRDSRYPFTGLSGVGVAFKLICACEYLSCGRDRSRELLAEYADLVSIGTVADVMPVTDENRVIIREGLKHIERSGRPGLRALLSEIRSSKTRSDPVNETTIGFQIAPRINAAGRMTSAMIAFELLTTENEQKAASLSRELCALNVERQTVENKIRREAEEMIEGYKNDKFILLAKEGWHRGVIGIAASKINERYFRPVILMSVEGDTAKGSGRGTKDLNLVDLLERSSSLIERFGGHEQAAGLTVRTDRIGQLRDRLNELLADYEIADDSCAVEMELTNGEISEELADQLQMLAPFGTDNEEPQFLLREAKISSVFSLSDGKHTKLTVDCGGRNLAALCFGTEYASFGICPNENADIIFTLSNNDFRNCREVQLIVKKIALSDSSVKARRNALSLPDRIRAGEAVLSPKDFPSIEECRKMYVTFRNLSASGVNKTKLPACLRANSSFDLTKFAICVDALKEKGLLVCESPCEEDGFSFTLPPFEGRIDLRSASVFNSIGNR